MYTSLIREKAKNVFPVLVEYARARKTLTYGELAEQIGWHPRPIYMSLGYIRDCVCVPNHLPYLSAIVVNRETRLPGVSFVPEGVAQLTTAERRELAQKIQNDVFDYPDWDKVVFDGRS